MQILFLRKSKKTILYQQPTQERYQGLYFDSSKIFWELVSLNIR